VDRFSRVLSDLFWWQTFFGKHFLTVKNSMVETKGMAVFNGAQTQKLE